MIRTYNCESVQNLLAGATNKTRLLLALQLASAVSALAFLGWQAIVTARIFNLFFTVAWVILEGVAAVWGCRVGAGGADGKPTASWEAKLTVQGLLRDYSALRYTKFLGLLCNFLGLVGAIKSMRFYGAVQWSAGLCVACLFLCLLWLREMNMLLRRLQSVMRIYNNFQMDVEDMEDENEQPSYRELL